MGMGRAPVATISPPDYCFLPVVATPVEGILATWRTATRRIVATSEDGGRPCCQPHQMAVAFSLESHTSSLLYSVHIHAALESGWHRWQPLNIAVATSYWRDASRRVSWQAAVAMAAYSCDQTMAALIFGWRIADNSNNGAVPALDGDGL
jgi:hypothetical protein